MTDRIFNTYSLLDRKAAFIVAALVFAIFANKAAYSADTTKASIIPSVDSPNVTVAAYYFPQWHVDPLNMSRRGVPWTEWEIIRTAKPRFHEHAQPKIPLWGYGMEDSPDVMAQKINAAASNGVGAFIFDWYYHESGPFLSGALENGYLKAPNGNRMSFAIMWANHKLREEPGEVSKATFKKIADHLVSDYFTNPAYWKIDGRPYFSIYEIDTFINGMGGIQSARDAIDYLRSLAIASGLKGIHLNVIDWQLRNRPDAAKLLRILGADSVASYTWVHLVPLKVLGFPSVEYTEVADRYLSYARLAKEKYGVPYYPNATMGWDPTPRMKSDQPHDGRGYPNTPVIVGNTPVRFKEVLQQIKTDLAVSSPSDRIVTINAWNEWGEGSYLEPDMVNGMEYLDAVRDVFGSVGAKH
jgi:hypothetical protein